MGRFMTSSMALNREMMSLSATFPRGQETISRAGEEDIDPAFNTHHTLLAVKIGEEWKIELFQNTPAQFHGRPHLVEQMTEELRRTMQGNDV